MTVPRQSRDNEARARLVTDIPASSDIHIAPLGFHPCHKPRGCLEMNVREKNQITVAVAAVLSAAAMSAAYAGGGKSLQQDAQGAYVAGDVHNHTTCSDGSISMQKLVKKSTDKQ